MQTRKVIILSLLLGAGIALYIVEFLYVPPLPIPGAKLGLANVVTLIILVFYTWRECFFNVIARTLVGSIVTGIFLTPAFFFSLTGALVSALAMVLVYQKFYGDLSLVGISVVGSTTHNLAQMILASLFIGHPGVFFQTPFLILIAIPTGIFNGVLSNHLTGRLSNLSGEILALEFGRGGEKSGGFE